jgi:hypothetical protein
MIQAKDRKVHRRTYATAKAILAITVTAALSFISGSIHAKTQEECEEEAKSCLRDCEGNRNWCAEPCDEWKRHEEEQCNQQQKECRDECDKTPDPGACVYEHCRPVYEACQRDIDYGYNNCTIGCDQDRWRCEQDCYAEYWVCS